MATPSYYQPFLNTLKNTQQPPRKTILFCFSIVAVFAFGCFLLPQSYPHSSINISSLCEKSLDHSSCLALILEAASPYINHELATISTIRSGPIILRKVLETHKTHINKAIEATKKYEMNKNRMSNIQIGGTLEDCLELMDLSRDRVANSIKLLKMGGNKYTNYDDIGAWLSAVLTNHVTCLDELEYHLPHDSLGLKSTVEGLISKGRALLAVHAKVSLEDPRNGIIPSILETSQSRTMLPSWLRMSDRKLLKFSGSEIEPDVVVAKDGTGNFTTVADAVASAPDKSKNRFVIYVKEGVYEENVEVGKTKKNVMIVGDGINVSVITGSLNVVDNSTTFRSATLAAVGDGFIMQDMTIQNTAGPEKHQAVALRVGADQSVINRCQIDAFQDTLYAHSLRQFYRDSYITGTVDFIFGNAAVVFQNCELVARLPMANQKNMVTAQGRTDPNQNTGTSIQYCDIIPSADLAPVKDQFPTYLGRPWKNFSRTVVMQSYIDDQINPKGWFEWDGDFALDTLYYGEYNNRGPGANTTNRAN